MDFREKNREELEKSIFGIEDSLIRSSLQLVYDGMAVESNFCEEVISRLKASVGTIPFIRIGNRYETAMLLHYVAAAMIAEEALLCVQQADRMSKLKEEEKDKVAHFIAEFLNKRQKSNVMAHHDWCYKNMIVPYIFEQKEQKEQKDAKTD